MCIDAAEATPRRSAGEPGGLGAGTARKGPDSRPGGDAVPGPRYPALYQINTRVWLTALSHSLGRRATLDDIVDGELDRLADAGFDHRSGC